MGPYRVNTDFTAARGGASKDLRARARPRARPAALRAGAPRVTRLGARDARPASRAPAFGRRPRERPTRRPVADELQVKLAVPRTGIHYVPLAAAAQAGLDANRNRLP